MSQDQGDVALLIHHLPTTLLPTMRDHMPQSELQQHHSQNFPPTPPSEPSTDVAKMSSDSTTTSSHKPGLSTSQHKHIWVITGPAGCGKTSVAEFLESTYSLPYLEGDTVRKHWRKLRRSSSLTSTRPLRTSILTCDHPVPPTLQRPKNGRRPTPNRRRPLGLAHPPSRRSAQSAANRLRRDSHLQRAQTKIPRRHARRRIPPPRSPRALCFPEGERELADGSREGEAESLYEGLYGAESV